MLRVLALLLVLVPVAFLAGRWSSADEEPAGAEPKLVRAQAYSIVWADSALDLSHGGGRRVHEIFFPDYKVAATVVFETEYKVGEEFEVVTRPRLHVWPADAPRSDLTGVSSADPAPPAEIEVVMVPADLAKAIATFAKLSESYRAEGLRMGQEVTSKLGLEDLGGAQ